MLNRKKNSYFRKLDSEIENILIQVKGNFRRFFIQDAFNSGALNSIPPAWLKHSLSLTLRDFLQSQDPRARGGEDLPDLKANQREIARVTLINSVHAEVVSLRGKIIENSYFTLNLVDEYETEIGLAEKKLFFKFKPSANNKSIFRI